ncbi:MAG: RluA family pseudouridine synthase [Planctomycetota bacterium]|nr:RluA family pseudouridine synthase [Planctomycetota bacterium]
MNSGSSPNPRPFRFTIDQDFAGSRLDRFLIQSLGFSSSLAQKSARKGWVRINGKRAKTGDRLTLGDEVRLTKPGLGQEKEAKKPGPKTKKTSFPKLDLEQVRGAIVFQDENILVAVKASGRVIHKGSGHPFGLVDLLAQITGSDFLAPIGRLDRDASGLLVFARNRATARTLDQALRDKSVQRVYTVLAFGQLQSQVIRAKLQTKVSQGGKERTKASVDGAVAVSHVKRAKDWPKNAPGTLSNVTIETGRTHQIRAHLASVGCPILGDPRYRSLESGDLDRKVQTPHLLLHAGELSFPSLESDTTHKFLAPPPTSFDKISKALLRM